MAEFFIMTATVVTAIYFTRRALVTYLEGVDLGTL
jgi:hypothetical protein